MDTKNKREFTVGQALEIQHEQLLRWELRLNRECFIALQTWCIQQNQTSIQGTDGYSVKRGSQLDEFVQNWWPKVGWKEEEQTPKMTNRDQAMFEVISALRYLAPSAIYEIAKEALDGNFDPFDVEETPCSNQVFFECWKIEKTNNGPWAFIRAMGDEYADRAIGLLRKPEL